MIQEFVEKVKSTGMARTNRYTVSFGAPTGFAHSGARLAGLFCDGAALPGMNIESAPHRIFSESRDMPYGVSYNPVTLNFYVDAKMELKDFFDKWHDSIVDPISRSLAYYETYTTTINIQLQDLSDAKTYEVQLIEAWPKLVGDVILSYESTGVMRLPVTFQYKKWSRVQ